jgi:hypothetical protein
MPLSVYMQPPKAKDLHQACSGPGAVRVDMRLTRWAVLAGVGRKLYSESRKPENQARVKAAITKVRSRRGRGWSSPRLR